MEVYFIERHDNSTGDIWPMLHLGLWTSKADAEEFIAIKWGGGDWINGTFVPNVPRFSFLIRTTYINA